MESSVEDAQNVNTGKNPNLRRPRGFRVADLLWRRNCLQEAGFPGKFPRSFPKDPIVQWPRTLPFHGGNTGSNPVRVALIMRDLRTF